MARTVSSLASPSVTSAISPHMARLTALRILGRLNTTVAMPPSRSTRISSLILLPLCASPRALHWRPRRKARRWWPLLRVTHAEDSLAEPSVNFNSPRRKPLVPICIFWDTHGMAADSCARRRGLPLGAIVVVVALALMPTPRAAPDEPTWRVYFSPNHGATQAVVDALAAAKATVLVQAYSLTSAPIAKALVEARARGVDVQVILDRKETGSKYSSADFMAHAKILTLIDDAHAIAHNKVMVIDGLAVITGSFNFTTAAEQRNAENLLIIHDRALAARYTENWRAHAAHSARY